MILEYPFDGEGKTAYHSFPAMPQYQYAAVQLSGMHYQLDCTGQPIDQHQVIRMDEPTLAKGLCICGAPRSGKTTVIAECTRQIKNNHIRIGKGKLIIFDVKGEYRQKLADSSSISIGVFEHQHRWNLFKDILAWGTEPESFSLHTAQLCEYLFDGQKCKENPFFVEAAKIITGCIIEKFIRNARENNDFSSLNNAVLYDFLSHMDLNKILDVLHEYASFESAVSLLVENEILTPDGRNYTTNRDGIGVYTEIIIMRHRIFRGAFAQAGDFSIIEFLKQRGRREVFLVSRSDVSDVTAAVFKYMIDAACDALGAGITDHENVCFVLDEFAQLPELNKLPKQMSLLPFQNVCFMVGLQNVEQVRTIYSDAKTANILDLFQTLICLTAPAATIAYMQKRLGKVRMTRQFSAPDGGITKEIIETEAVETYEIQQQEPGEAFVRMPSGESFQFKFDLYA